MNDEYHREKSKEHYRKYKAQYNARNTLQRRATKKILDEYKASGCTRCPEKRLACLDFYHLGDKDMAVSQMLGMNEERVRAEIAKCIVLCANCHRCIHAEPE